MLHHTDQGQGSPALLLHSGGLSSRQWRVLASQLQANHRVLNPDLIGYGGSGPLAPGAGFHFRDDLDALEELLAPIAEPVHLVGHSYGGLLALQLALRAPQRVRSLALYEPVAFGILHGSSDQTEARLIAEESRAMEALADDRDGQGGGEAWMERFVDWWQGAGVWRSLPEGSRAAFLSAGRKTFLEVQSLLADRTPPAAYAALAAPALILAGGRSPEVERMVCRKLAAALPRGRLELLAGAGHMGPLTHLAEVNSKIAAFIDAS